MTFIAHMVPSRQDVPEYAEYLEKIEALVAVVNHRHGTTDWMPIDLKLRENLEEAIAAYKHYDLLIVNAMFDGMNLVAKEGPLVNERHGVSLLSENTGAHEELGEFALSVNPFDVQEQADAIYKALTMSAEERSWRAEGLKKIVTARDPGDWVDDQLRDIEAKRLGKQPHESEGAFEVVEEVWRRDVLAQRDAEELVAPRAPARVGRGNAAARGAGGTGDGVTGAAPQLGAADAPRSLFLVPFVRCAARGRAPPRATRCGRRAERVARAGYHLRRGRLARLLPGPLQPRGADQHQGSDGEQSGQPPYVAPADRGPGGPLRRLLVVVP